ncbi:MAG: AEC family transporter [Acidaminobacteraceae bacterium]
MQYFIYILINVISPIFTIILLGYLLQRRFKLSIYSLSKVQIFVFIPSLVFINIYNSTLDKSLMGSIVLYTTILFFIFIVLSTLVSRILKLPKAKEKAFVNSISLRNQGNFGIPLVALLYTSGSSQYAMSIHMIGLIATTILMYTVGLYNASSGTYTSREAFKNILKLPIIYVMVLAILARQFGVVIAEPQIATLTYLAKAVVPLALITLGAQLEETKFDFSDKTVYLGNFLRLIVSPVIAYLLCIFMGIDGVARDVLVIGAATPTAVNSVLLAIEFDGNSNYASQTVFTSTIFSSVTIAIVINILKFV